MSRAALMRWVGLSAAVACATRDPVRVRGLLASSLHSREEVAGRWPENCLNEAAALARDMEWGRRRLSRKKKHAHSHATKSAGWAAVVERWKRPRGSSPRVALLGHWTSRGSSLGHAGASFAQMKVLRFLFGEAVIGYAATLSHSSCCEFTGLNESSECLVETRSAGSCSMSALEAMLSADVVVATPAVHWGAAGAYEQHPAMRSTYGLARFAAEVLRKPVWLLNSVFHVHGFHHPSRQPANCTTEEDECEAARSLAVADWLVARDPLSSRWLRHYVPGVAVAGPAADLTFLLPSDLDDAARAHLLETRPSLRHKCGDGDDCLSLAVAATALPAAQEGTRQLVVAALVEMCDWRPKRPVRLVEYRHLGGGPNAKPTPKSIYAADAARLVKSGICADGTSTEVYSPHGDSFTLTVELMRRQDLVIAGTFHLACYARLARAPALLLPGVDSALTDELADLFHSVQPDKEALDYVAVPREELLAGNKMLMKTKVKDFCRRQRSSDADSSLGLDRLRRLAFANLAPFAPTCLHADPALFDAYFPKVATLADVLDQDRFLAGRSTWVGWHNCSSEADRACQSNAACFPAER